MASSMWVKLFRQGCRISRHQQRSRGYCSRTKDPDAILSTPMSDPLPGQPMIVYPTVEHMSSETKVTVLENGLRVASEKTFGPFCTVGVLIDSGSRYEVAYPAGISHFLEKLAFSSTTEYQDKDLILQSLERNGGICDCQSSRDTLIYAMSADATGLPDLVNILSEVTLRPCISDEELEDTRMAVQFEIENLEMNPDPQPLLLEMAHTAAYRGNTLGLPKICPVKNIHTIDRKMLYSYMKNFHTPERMVVAGVGVDHDEFVKHVQEHFVDKKQPIWLDSPDAVHASKSCDNSIAQYTGGKVLVEKDLSNVSLGPNPMPELGHIVIGLESCSHKDDDFISFCVLNMMLGGGGSFSAGGPGKGMYTRLYTNVLNRYHWINNAVALNHSYEDSGLFCIHANSHPRKLKELTGVIIQELLKVTGNIDKEELDRAKAQLQSMLLMNLEARPVVFEDIGRQVLSYNERKQSDYYIDAIDKIKDTDINRVGERMLNSKPAVAAYGSLGELPSYENIENMLLRKTSASSRMFSFFR